MDFSKLKVVELKTELSERGLSTAGRKDEMIARLVEYEEQRQQGNVPASEPSPSLQAAPASSPAPAPSISPISEPVVAEATASAAQTHSLSDDAERLRLRALRFGIPVEQQEPPEDVLKRTMAKLDQPLKLHGYRRHHGSGRKHRPS